jgi:hypothetical protein
LDKYEYTIKSDKIKKLTERRDYETAAKIADTIDWERVKNVKMLSIVSQAYEKTGRLEEAKDLLLMAYECAPVGRRFLYKLTELAARQGKFDEAEDYLQEYTEVSPHDPGRLLLRYEIARAKEEPPERLIMILEAYQKREFEEKWAYELAELYYGIGKTEECIKLCDEIVLWFGVGTYVDKAMELKQKMVPLSPEQIEKRENKEKYLRRLKDIQKEFEKDPSSAQKRPSAGASSDNEKPSAERKVLSLEEQISEALKEPGTPKVEMIPEDVPAQEAEELSEKVPKTGLAKEKQLRSTREEPLQTELQTEEEAIKAMEATLAREIETAAMAATIDEAMLRKTAATMETVGAVENDHSDVSERTKIAPERFGEKTQTKEFVLQARAINSAMEQAQGIPVTAEEVESRLTGEMQENIFTDHKTAEREEPVSGEPADEEPAVGESVQEEAPEPALAEETVCPEPAVDELSGREVRDHYVLIASDNEERGLRECVTYIRRMRELLGRPASQVAKISGEKLANKDIEKTLRKLQGRDLIVVGISELPPAVLVQTIEQMAKDRTESFVALIDTQEEIGKLQTRMAFFGDCRVLSCQRPERKGGASGVSRTSDLSEKPMETPKPAPAPAPRQPLSLAELVQETLEAGVLDGMLEEAGAESTGEPAQENSPAAAELSDGRKAALRRKERRARQKREEEARCQAEQEEQEKASRQAEQEEREKESRQAEQREREKARRQAEQEEKEVARRQAEQREKEVARRQAEQREKEVARRQAEQKAQEEAYRQAEQERQEKARRQAEAAGQQETEKEEKPRKQRERQQKKHGKVRREEAAACAEELILEPEAVQEQDIESFTKVSDPDHMSPKEFYNFAVGYARMLDAVVDDMGSLAFFAVIEQYQQERIALSEELAEEMIEKAILCAERRSFKSLFSNRYDKEGYLILKEEHFKE